MIPVRLIVMINSIFIAQKCPQPPLFYHFFTPFRGGVNVIFHEKLLYSRPINTYLFACASVYTREQPGIVLQITDLNEQATDPICLRRLGMFDVGSLVNRGFCRYGTGTAGIA